MGAEQQAALIQAYIRADGQMRERVLALVLQMFTGLGSWRGEDVDRFVSAAVPVVLGAQRQVGSLTDAYIRTLLSDMLGGTVRASGAAPSTGATLRNGTEPAEVYARPLRTVWRALAEGKGLDEALSVARVRLVQIVTTDLQLAKTHAARAAMSADGRVVGYRRVLTGVKTCGICVVASTQRYHRQDLMPIHPACDCGVAPIVGTKDPGHVLDAGLLDQAHAAIADRFGVSAASGRGSLDYRDVLITHEHGEIGPVIARRGDHFEGPQE